MHQHGETHEDHDVMLVLKVNVAQHELSMIIHDPVCVFPSVVFVRMGSHVVLLFPFPF